MSIVIFGDLFSFPDGLAATNRIYTYAKGFNENGIKVHVICFSNNYMRKPNGVIDGIAYYNPFGREKRSRYFLARRWHKLRKYARTYSILKKINREDKISVINRWSDTVLTQFFIWMLARIFRAKLIAECNEHPLRYYNNGTWTKRIGNGKFYIDACLSDGIVCISKYLVDFHKTMGIKEKKLFMIPSTVDPGRFIQAGTKPVNSFYIGYFGSLTFKRDNVDALIKAFAQISPRHKEVKLVLGGFCPDEERKKIVDLIDALNINERVELLEYLTRQEIIKYIVHADVLVMTRAKDLESDASYPSKLTEFLATGKPVVSMNVGEISDYLEDGINAFITKAGDAEELAEKLDYIIRNYQQAVCVGKKGKEVASGVFNYRYQSKRFIEFIQMLNN